jgi:NAD(P)-dependent dehydrogenase (short-subunit alcohol dehydrogenase family)
MGILDGKVAIVTGAAGGLGSAATRLLAAEGARVLVADVRAEPLGALVDEVRAAGGEASVHLSDVTDGAAVAAMVRAAQERYGGLHILFNNAGIEGRLGRLAELDDDDFDQVMAVNARGVWLGLRHGIPAIVASGGGSVVNAASAAGLKGLPRGAPYTASKHAVIGLTRAAAIEYARDGVRVNAICPGYTDTEMVTRTELSIAPGSPERARERLLRPIPMRRYGTADEVAQLVLFLASDRSSFITGAAYSIDGGTTA